MQAERSILVAGGGGYIGLRLCEHLLALGHQVTVFDRFYFGLERAKAFLPDGARFLQGDIRDIDPKDLQGVGTVIDLAGLSNDAAAMLSEDLTRSINVDGAMKLARAAKSAGVSHFVYSSSASVYGASDAICAEDSPCNPLSLYAVSKLDVERQLVDLAGPDFRCTLLRNGTVFGWSPRMRFDIVVNTMLRAARVNGQLVINGTGQQHRPFVHVCDVAGAFATVAAAVDDLPPYAIYNVSGLDGTYTINDLAELIAEHLNVPITRNPAEGDPRSYRVDVTKIERDLGFTARRTVLEGLEEMSEKFADEPQMFHDPSTNTADWYAHLLHQEALVASLQTEKRKLVLA